MRTIQRAHDLTAMSIGFVANIFLIFVNRKFKRSSFGELSRAILVCAVTDLAYSFVTLITQRVMVVKSGALMGIGYGLETHVPKFFGYIIGCADEFFVSQAVTMLPVQYYYRYAVTNRRPFPNWALLLKCTLASSLLSLGFIVMSAWSFVVAERRGEEYYLELLGSDWNETDGRVYFVGAHDTHDWVTIFYYTYSLVLTTICYGLCGFYGYKLFRLIKSPDLNLQSLTEAKRSLLRQFTRNLILQTLISYIATISPGAVVMTTLWWGGDGGIVGPLCTSIIAWTPGLNAIVTLMVIQPYRVLFVKALTFRAASVFSSARKSIVENISQSQNRMTETNTNT